MYCMYHQLMSLWKNLLGFSSPKVYFTRLIYLLDLQSLVNCYQLLLVGIEASIA